ncbi:MAG: tetratricopeptide repeat protein, partial [Bryobacteraceae bacterium]
ARGTVQFWYNDLDRALDNMKRVAARSGVLDLNTGTYAWLRMGQIYDLKGQRTHAVSAYQTAIRIAPESDAARLSKRYLSEPYRRKKQGT